MKVWMDELKIRGRQCFRFKAKIIKSRKHGIPQTVQKTWRAYADDSMYNRTEIRKSFMAEARRWQHKKLLTWFSSPEKFPKQNEFNECDEASVEEQPMSSVQATGLVSGGEVAGPVHEGPVGTPEDAGGRELGIPPST